MLQGSTEIAADNGSDPGLEGSVGALTGRRELSSQSFVDRREHGGSRRGLEKQAGHAFLCPGPQSRRGDSKGRVTSGEGKGQTEQHSLLIWG